MRHAETVTFGGSGLDRAAELRSDSAEIESLWLASGARVLPMWRGKPLIAGPARDRAGLLPTDHPLLGHAAPDRLLLGRDDAGPIFAADVSAWTPDASEAATLGAFFDPSEQVPPGVPDDHRFAELRTIMAAVTPRAGELCVTARALFNWHATHGFCARCGARTRVTMGGWQRVCPDCGGNHFPRTDPVVIMLITRGNALLLGRSHGWPEGMYSCLAGFIEPGETMEAAVRREVAEETGVQVGAVRYLSSQPWPFPNSLMLGCHGGALTDTVIVDPYELDDALWVGREEMAQAWAGAHPVIKPARRGAIAHFLIGNWLADTLD